MMFDDLIDIFSLRDLVTPLVSFFQDIFYGPSVFFGVPSIAGFSKREVGRLLDRKKIKNWGMMYDGHLIIFNVPEKQQDDAYRVLRQAGIGVVFPKLDVKQ